MLTVHDDKELLPQSTYLNLHSVIIINMVHQMTFTISYFGINNTIITYDYLHEDVYYRSPITYIAQLRVKLYAAQANRE